MPSGNFWVRSMAMDRASMALATWRKLRPTNEFVSWDKCPSCGTEFCIRQVTSRCTVNHTLSIATQHGTAIFVWLLLFQKLQVVPNYVPFSVTSAFNVRHLYESLSVYL